MMDMSMPHAWKEEFAIAAEIYSEKIHGKELIKAFEAIDQETRDKQRTQEKKADKKRQEEREALEATLATSEQIADFGLQLDDYDTQTVGALMDNGEALDSIHAKLDQKLDQAYVLPDGRRLFKNVDGHQVFDEYGADLSKEVNPALIEDRRLTWNAFKADKDIESKLESERHGLLAFQAKVDDARARVDKSTITSKELDDLGADLKASMPPSLRQKPDQGMPQVDDAAKPRPDDMSPAPAPAPVPVTGLDDPARRDGPRPAPM